MTLSFHRFLALMLPPLAGLFLIGCLGGIQTSTGSAGSSGSYAISGSSPVAATDAAAYVYFDVPEGWELTNATYNVTVNGAPQFGLVPTLLGPTDGPCGNAPPPAAGYQRFVFASQVFPTTSMGDDGMLFVDFDLHGGTGSFTLAALAGGGTQCATEGGVTRVIEVLGDPLAPTPTKSFSPATIATGGTSTLTINLRNQNDTALTGISFTDAYPAGVVTAPVPNATTTCAGGSVTGAAGSSSVGLSGASLPGQGTCTVTIDVTAAAPGEFANMIGAGTVSTAEVTRPNIASNNATLTVNAVVLGAPAVAKAFAPGLVVLNGVSTLTVTLTNPNAVPVTGVAFTDTYPAGLVNAPAPNATTSCGGTVTAASGGGSLAISGATIPASGSCAVSVDVTAATAGSYSNVIPAGGVTSANAPANTSAASSGPLTVLAAGAAIAAIPTLTEWTLMLLAMALGLIALRVLRG